MRSSSANARTPVTPSGRAASAAAVSFATTARPPVSRAAQMASCKNVSPTGSAINVDGDRRGRGRHPADTAGRVTAYLRKQLLSGLSVLDEDGADRAVLGCLEDLLDGVTRGIDGFRLAVVVEAKHLRGDRLAHGIPDADVVVYPNAQLASQRISPTAR